MTDCLGVVLAGGLSSRMGEDKSYLPRGDQTMLDYTSGLLQQLGLEVVVSGQPQIGGIADAIAEAGPVGGIYSVLQQHPASELLIVPVDMPLLSVPILRYLLGTGRQRKAASYYKDCYLPLYLPVTGAVKNHLVRLFGGGEKPENKRLLSIRSLLAETENQALPAEHRDLLVNTNTPEEWRSALRGLRETGNAQ